MTVEEDLEVVVDAPKATGGLAKKPVRMPLPHQQDLRPGPAQRVGYRREPGACQERNPEGIRSITEGEG